MINIDKTRYKSRLNKLILLCIVSLIVLSLGISSTIIYLVNDGEKTHFWINVLGVVMGVAIIATLLSKYKSHPYMYEIAYVWDLKQVLNQIHRKSSKINKALEQDDIGAIEVMYFYYQGCLQLYTLDDNTITLSSLNKKADELNQTISRLNLTITTDNFSLCALSKF